MKVSWCLWSVSAPGGWWPGAGSLAWSPGSSCAGPEAGLQLTAVWAGVISQLQSRLQTAGCLVCSLCLQQRPGCTGGWRPVFTKGPPFRYSLQPGLDIITLAQTRPPQPSFNISRDAKLFDTHVHCPLAWLRVSHKSHINAVKALTVPSDGSCTSGTTSSFWSRACGRWPPRGPPSSPSPTDTSLASPCDGAWNAEY